MIVAAMRPVGALAFKPTFPHMVRLPHATKDIRKYVIIMKDAQRDIQLKKDIRLPNGAHFPIARAIRKHRMFTPTTVGSGMTQVAMMSTSALITHGRTDTSPVHVEFLGRG